MLYIETAAYIYKENIKKKYIYIHLYIYIEISIYISISKYIYICCCFKWKTKAIVIFLNPFAVCSLCKLEFVIRPFSYKETIGSYLFADGLNGLNRLAHLWVWSNSRTVGKDASHSSRIHNSVYLVYHVTYD